VVAAGAALVVWCPKTLFGTVKRREGGALSTANLQGSAEVGARDTQEVPPPPVRSVCCPLPKRGCLAASAGCAAERQRQRDLPPLPPQRAGAALPLPPLLLLPVPKPSKPARHKQSSQFAAYLQQRGRFVCPTVAVHAVCAQKVASLSAAPCLRRGAKASAAAG